MSFNFIKGESIILNLDLEGICGSTGSACSSSSLEPSHILLAMGLSPEKAHGSLRLTLGKLTTEEEIEQVLDVLPRIVGKLRATSPLFKIHCPVLAEEALKSAIQVYLSKVKRR